MADLSASATDVDPVVGETPENDQVVLADGRRINIRNIKRADERPILEFLQSLTPESRRRRFFTAGRDLKKAARSAADADGVENIGLVATDKQGRILAHAVSCQLYGSRAELAIEVAEHDRREGIATTMINMLVQAAAASGIRTMIAEVLPDNHDMCEILLTHFNAREVSLQGVNHFEFSTNNALYPPLSSDPQE